MREACYRERKAKRRDKRGNDVHRQELSVKKDKGPLFHYCSRRKRVISTIPLSKAKCFDTIVYPEALCV